MRVCILFIISLRVCIHPFIVSLCVCIFFFIVSQCVCIIFFIVSLCVCIHLFIISLCVCIHPLIISLCVCIIFFIISLCVCILPSLLVTAKKVPNFFSCFHRKVLVGLHPLNSVGCGSCRQKEKNFSKLFSSSSSLFSSSAIN